jgi:hypothetical protein
MANATASPREMLSFAFARRGSRFEAQPFGRPLEITPAALAALPPAAQPVWAPNLTQ